MIGPAGPRALLRGSWRARGAGEDMPVRPPEEQDTASGSGRVHAPRGLVLVFGRQLWPQRSQV